jgi:hypothetical protein
MKTSKKILLAVAVMLLALWSIALFVVRKDMKSMLANQHAIAYKPLAVDKFVGLDFSSNWIVSIHARITAPSLQLIKAAGDTKIQMKTFWSDSLTVILEDSSSFAGSKNDFDYIQFNASRNDR